MLVAVSRNINLPELRVFECSLLEGGKFSVAVTPEEKDVPTRHIVFLQEDEDELKLAAVFPFDRNERKPILFFRPIVSGSHYDAVALELTDDGALFVR